MLIEGLLWWLSWKKKKNPPDNAGDPRDTDSIPGSERSPAEGNGNPLKYSCLENHMERGACGSQSMGHKELDMTEHTCPQACSMKEEEEILDMSREWSCMEIL